MLTCTIVPRISETDALGHIGNTVLPVWFESARTPIFWQLHPSRSLEGWPIIAARIEVDYLHQLFVDSDVTIHTSVKKIGTKSFTIYQEAWQKNYLAAKGISVMVSYDFEKKSTCPLTGSQRVILENI